MSERGENVPRVAAMLASLMLIIGSIGINIARYPTVGQIVPSTDGPQASASAHTHVNAVEVLTTPQVVPLPTTADGASQSSIARKVVKTEPTRTAAPVPAPRPESVDAVASVAPAQSDNRAVAADTANDPAQVPIRIVAVRPLVNLEPENPFVSPAANAPASSPATEYATEAVVESLPSLDRVMLADQSATDNLNNETASQVIVYPRTSTP